MNIKRLVLLTVVYLVAANPSTMLWPHSNEVLSAAR